MFWEFMALDPKWQIAILAMGATIFIAAFTLVCTKVDDWANA